MRRTVTNLLLQEMQPKDIRKRRGGVGWVTDVPMAWRRRQAMSNWRWGPIKWRGAPTPAPQVQRHFIGPKRHLEMARRRRQAMGRPSNWERSVNGNAIT